ncbi:hypothetical protein PTKIN_Ptkin14bG0139300 [Pterospermum kingtungense]
MTLPPYLVKDRATGAEAESTAYFVEAVDAANFDDFVDANDFDDATNTDLDGIEDVSTGATTLQELEGFTCIQLVKVGAYISKDEWKVQYFFALPKESRIEFVKLQFQEIAPSAYHPSFDNFPSSHDGY